MPRENVSPEYRRFARFVVVGGACYLLNLLVLHLGVERLGMHYVPANLLSLALLVPIGHFLNRRHTFASRRRYAPEMLRFGLAIALQTLVALAAIAVLVEFAGVHYLVANVVVTGASLVVSYVVQRRLVFRAHTARHHAEDDK